MTDIFDAWVNIVQLMLLVALVVMNVFTNNRLRNVEEKLNR